MKKLTLLKFPFEYYEPVRKTSDMGEAFTLIKNKKKEEEERELEKLIEQVRILDQRYKDFLLKETTYTAEQLVEYDKDPSYIEWGKIGKELHERYKNAIHYKQVYCYTFEERDAAYKRHHEEMPEIAKKGRELKLIKLHNYDRLKERIAELEALAKKTVPLMPTPLQYKHLHLINREIEKMYSQGYDLESYQLLETEFHNSNHLQKCYSGVVFTWKRIDHFNFKNEVSQRKTERKK